MDLGSARRWGQWLVLLFILESFVLDFPLFDATCMHLVNIKVEPTECSRTRNFLLGYL